MSLPHECECRICGHKMSTFVSGASFVQKRCGAPAGGDSPLTCNREAGHLGDHMEGLNVWPNVESREDRG